MDNDHSICQRLAMMLDEDQAKLFATIVDAKPPQDGGGFGGE